MNKRILTSNFTYLVGSAANGAAAFLLLPYLVGALSPTDFGIWSIFEVVLIFLNVIILAGTDVFLMRTYWFLEDIQERRSLFGTMLIALSVWGSFLFVAVVAAGNLFRKLGLVQEISISSFVFMGAIGFFEALFALLLSIFRIQEKSLTYVSLSLGRMILFIAAAVFWIRAGAGINGALAGRLIAGCVFVLIAGILASKSIHLQFDKRYLSRWLGYGLPMLPAGIFFYILIASDRYLLGALSGLQAVAVYSFTYKIASLLDYFVNRPFATDWAARRFLIATQENPKQKYALIALLFAFISVGVAILAQCFAPVVYAWFAPALYLRGLEILPVLLVANVLMGLSNPLNVGIMLKDQTKILPFITLGAGIVYILLLWWLIPRYEIMGAAWATLFAYLVYTVGIAWFSNRFYPVKYPLGSWLTIGLGFLLAEFSIYGISSYSNLSMILKVMLQAGASLAILVFTGIIILRQQNLYSFAVNFLRKK